MATYDKAVTPIQKLAKLNNEEGILLTKRNNAMKGARALNDYVAEIDKSLAAIKLEKEQVRREAP